MTDAAWGGGYWEDAGPAPLIFLTMPQITERSQLDRSTVYRAMASGQLAFIQHPGGGRRVEEIEYVSWMKRGFPTS